MTGCSSSSCYLCCWQERHEKSLDFQDTLTSGPARNKEENKMQFPSLKRLLNPKNISSNLSFSSLCTKLFSSASHASHVLGILLFGNFIETRFRLIPLLFHHFSLYPFCQRIYRTAVQRIYRTIIRRILQDNGTENSTDKDDFDRQGNNKRKRRNHSSLCTHKTRTWTFLVILLGFLLLYFYTSKTFLFMSLEESCGDRHWFSF